MELTEDDLNKLAAAAFTQVTTYRDMTKALREVLYARGMPKHKTRELVADLLKSLEVREPEALSFNGSEVAQLLERMIHFVTINTWALQQFCDDCNETGTRCDACATGIKVYKHVPEISATLIVKGKPKRVFSGDASPPITIEFSFRIDDPRAQNTLFETEFPEMTYETKLWLTDSWKALKRQYDIDKKETEKPRDRGKLIEELRQSGQVHQLSILLFKESRCLNCGDVRPTTGKKKYYCSDECDKDFGQWFKDWTRKHRYKGEDLDRVVLERLRKVLLKKRDRGDK